MIFSTEAQATTYELAFYHHFPVDISVCFAYGYGEPTTSIGPLNYKEVGYARIPANSSTNQISVETLKMGLFSIPPAGTFVEIQPYL
eukprot:g23328.t1